MHIQNVEEALRTVPGVQFLNYGPTNINQNIDGIRINGSKDIVILVDGIRVNALQGAGYSGYANVNLMKNMDNIERIEVLRGAASTVYGSGAKGGVINIITKKANKIETVLDASRGAFGRQNYNVNTQGKIDKFSYTAYYGYSKQGNVKDPRGFTWLGDSKSKNGGFTLAYAANDNSKFSLMYNHGKTTYDAFNPFSSEKGDHIKDSYYENTDITIRHNYKFSDLWSNDISYRNSKNNTKYYSFYIDDWGTTQVSNNINDKYVYDFFNDQITYTAKDHTVVAGIDYTKAKSKTPKVKWNGAPYPNAIYEMKNTSLYVQDDWKILPNVTLSGGVRYDKPDQQGGLEFESHTSKSYKLSYDITPKDTIYAGRSEFYILPSILQVSDPKYGNPKLLPSYGRTSSIGYTRTFSDKNSFMFNWFYTKSDRTINMKWDGTYDNGNNEVARGWNAQWSSKLDQHWTLNLGWAHLFQKNQDDIAFYEGYQPKDLATLGLYYHSGKWTGGLDGFYFIRRTDGIPEKKKNLFPSDKYGVFNLSVNYKATKEFEVYAKVENIFNKLWAEHSYVLDYYGGPGAYMSQPRRNLTLGVQYKF